MKKSAILVLDMLNEYLTEEGRIFCKECRNIIPTIRSVLDVARVEGIPVVYVNSTLSRSDVLVKKWGLHAERGSAAAQVVPELSPEAGDHIVEKTTYNGFFNTNLHELLQSLSIDHVLVTGIHTHVCVLLTATSAFEHGYDVSTLEDCITTGFRPNHDSRLRFFETHVGELITSIQWIESFDGEA